VRQQVNLVALGDFMGPGGGKKGKGVGPLPIAGTNTVSMLTPSFRCSPSPRR
jgi:hypothetical protein